MRDHSQPIQTHVPSTEEAGSKAINNSTLRVKTGSPRCQKAVLSCLNNPGPPPKPPGRSGCQANGCGAKEKQQGML